jgi:hypothetical protein
LTLILHIEKKYIAPWRFFMRPFSFLRELFSSKTQERYKSIRENNIGRLDQHSKSSGEHESPMSMNLEKNLSDALDSLDNLFCRRCLVCTKASFFNIIIIIVIVNASILFCFPAADF